MILLEKQYLKKTENILQPFKNKKKAENWFMVKPQNLDNLNSDFLGKQFLTAGFRSFILHSPCAWSQL